ncbi:MAG: hypothetical protein RIT45_3389 [Pseudomonadota bacterium]|jgi:agmatine/peptidylarginine deiminase
MSEPSIRLPAEWEPQDGVMLTWPHAETDWAPLLDRAQACFVAIAAAVAARSQLLVVCHDAAVRKTVQAQLAAAGVALERVHLALAPCDDTWARDHGPITVETPAGLRLRSFHFNGWGGKFPALQDDAINVRLGEIGVFAAPVEVVELELEGGAIESDGRGTILTTSACLLNDNRNNGGLSRAQAEAALARELGATRVLWLEHGHLEGDDTDSHVDTLARLAPGADGQGHTIVYQRCDDVADDHYGDLAAMERELQALRTADGAPYDLLALPWPRPAYDDEGHRLPATYANYLILDDAVLVPTYADPADAAALAVVAAAHPGREVVGIDCRALIEQHGSLHCVTMQLPRGTLAGAQEVR